MEAAAQVHLHLREASMLLDVVETVPFTALSYYHRYNDHQEQQRRRQQQQPSAAAAWGSSSLFLK